MRQCGLLTVYGGWPYNGPSIAVAPYGASADGGALRPVSPVPLSARSDGALAHSFARIGAPRSTDGLCVVIPVIVLTAIVQRGFVRGLSGGIFK